MSTRELILLSPYRLPAHNTLYLGDEAAACFLNGGSALWHPAALTGAAAPPRVAMPYDHEQPLAGHLYALPASPPLMLPEDWEQRARQAGALSFQATADRAETLANLRAALRTEEQLPAELASRLDVPIELARPFFGIGLGYHHLEALCEAMSHENLLSPADLWQDVQKALAALPEGLDAVRRLLQAAADRLMSAREVLYSSTIHVVDLSLLEGQPTDAAWPGGPDMGLAGTVVASAAWLERLQREHPDRLALLRQRVEGDLLEVCGGGYLEREDALLPLESQLWNLLHGQAVCERVLGQPYKVYARKRFGFHPQTPSLLQQTGFTRAVLLSFDESVVPFHRSAVINWPAPDGKQVEAFTRTPFAADSPQTYFHLAYHLYQTIMQDMAATLALLHKGKPPAPWYHDWLELSRLSPVLGRWTTLSGYFNEVTSGDYTSAALADDFHDDYLVERVPANLLEIEGGAEPVGQAEKPAPQDPPVSGLAVQVRERRRLDTAWTLAALNRGLGSRPAADTGEPLETRLARLEDRFEGRENVAAEEIQALQNETAQVLAQRLVARGANQPGYLILNPCSFKRRIVIEMPGMTALLPIQDPVKACQLDSGLGRVVVEVPALGFAWIPRDGVPGMPAPPRRLRLADERMVRNEFFEAEIDPASGGLRAVRDLRTRVNRLGQQLVFNPGSTMRLRNVQVTSTGPALGEIITEGVLVDAQDQELATYRQRLQAWLGRPLLDMRIEIHPLRPPRGFPWHAYYAARFAWRDENAALLRGVNGHSYITGHTRPQSPEYLELRQGAKNTVLFPGGLPFHQRHASRMIDLILITAGETCQVFDIGIALDRPLPMQTALGLVTPAPVVPTTQGPPHVGTTGWLFHLDAANLLLTSLRPGADGSDAVIARMLECSGSGTAAELRCVRNPSRAMLIDARGTSLMDLTPQGDALSLDVPGHDLVQVRVEFS